MKKDKRKTHPWTKPMNEARFDLMRRVLAAPSPIGLEGAMTYGVIKPELESFMPKGWAIHQFKGNAGIVCDTHPGRDDLCSVMIIGHADKIRLQVRHIGEDGKVWVNSDSFLPVTLIGHEVTVFSANPDKPGEYRRIEGGTIEAIGAIHFAPPGLRNGDKGIKPEMLYLELQLHGKDRKKQVEKAGIKPGDTILMNRPIRRGFGENTFYGAYLDNGLGSYVTLETARLLADRLPDTIRVQFAIAAYEEIGRFGSRVFAGVLKPDIVIGVDVDHDYAAAPGVGDQRYSPVTIGEGPSLATGAITSEYLNGLILKAARKRDIPVQLSPAGRDTGTDAMAASLASVDAAAASVGIPLRNMHTISESGHTGDVLAAIHLLAGLVEDLGSAHRGKGLARKDLEDNHPRLDRSVMLKR